MASRWRALAKNARQKGERVPLHIISSILVDALQGLHGAHDAKSEIGEPLGIVHRDVSPQNIFGRRGRNRTHPGFWRGEGRGAPDDARREHQGQDRVHGARAAPWNRRESSDRRLWCFGRALGAARSTTAVLRRQRGAAHRFAFWTPPSTPQSLLRRAGQDAPRDGGRRDRGARRDHDARSLPRSDEAISNGPRDGRGARPARRSRRRAPKVAAWVRGSDGRRIDRAEGAHLRASERMTPERAQLLPHPFDAGPGKAGTEGDGGDGHRVRGLRPRDPCGGSPVADVRDLGREEDPRAGPKSASHDDRRGARGHRCACDRGLRFPRGRCDPRRRARGHTHPGNDDHGDGHSSCPRGSGVIHGRHPSGRRACGGGVPHAPGIPATFPAPSCLAKGARTRRRLPPTATPPTHATHLASSCISHNAYEALPCSRLRSSAGVFSRLGRHVRTAQPVRPPPARATPSDAHDLLQTRTELLGCAASTCPRGDPARLRAVAR